MLRLVQWVIVLAVLVMAQGARRRIKIILHRFIWMGKKSAKFTTCFEPTKRGW